MAAPPSPATEGRAGRWLGFAVGIALTIAAAVGVTQLWPDDDANEPLATEAPAPTLLPGVVTTAPGATGEPSQQPTVSASSIPSAPINLFATGLPDVLAQLASAAGGPSQVLEVAVYDTYAFLAYRDPANPANIDRRMWRDGEVDAADANPIDDRVDADTEPRLFSLAELDLRLIPGLAADAVIRYDLPVQVTHVLIDRFLPFDERVLIRVYATPTDGRSGGGYVSYDTAGAFVKVCC